LAGGDSPPPQAAKAATTENKKIQVAERILQALLPDMGSDGSFGRGLARGLEQKRPSGPRSETFVAKLQYREPGLVLVKAAWRRDVPGRAPGA
jgi:hypothetical protein